MDEITRLEYEGKITANQGYQLRRLAKEGYDVSPALEGRISGIRRCTEMDKCIRTGNINRIMELIEETRRDEEEEERLLKEHLNSVNYPPLRR